MASPLEVLDDPAAGKGTRSSEISCEAAVRFHLRRAQTLTISEPYALCQCPQIGLVDSSAQQRERLYAVVLKLRIIEPRVDEPQGMEMIEDQRIFVDEKLFSSPLQGAVGQIPWGEVGAFVFQNHDPLEAIRPIVQVFLVGEAAVFNPGIAPFQAFLSPPPKTCLSAVVPSEGEPPDIILAVSFQMIKIVLKAVGDYGYGSGAKFIEKRAGICEEKKVRIEIGDKGYLRMLSQNMQRQRGGAGEVVFDSTTGSFCHEKFWIVGF